MSNSVTVHKGRTCITQLYLGIDVSDDTIISEIREQPDKDSALIATWTVAFATDGTDGELILTLDNAITALITQSRGYMDVKRIVGGEPIPAFDGHLDVIFKPVVTE